MGMLFSAARAAYRKFTPAFVRESSFIALIREVVPHDLWYDESYYLTVVDPSSTNAASAMAPAIVRDLSPRTLIDVGCGTGALIAALRDQGCTVSGLEYAQAGLNLCRSRGLDVRKFDLEHDELKLPGGFDLAITMEVAEHLPERFADRFVNLLTSLAPVVVFTAASPGQGGTDHVNEQPASYWIAKFNVHGYQLDSALSDRWREEWHAAEIASWYWKNIMIFRWYAACP